jgi:hypothetical protein
MVDLRETDTNSADDAVGRVFGLEGNLYLPILLALIGGLGVFATLGLVFQLPWSFAGMIGGLPPLGIAAWVVLLRHGKPPGYDRDFVAQRLGHGHFTKHPAQQEGFRS